MSLNSRNIFFKGRNYFQIRLANKHDLLIKKKGFITF